jgi:hypothetical protein
MRSTVISDNQGPGAGTLGATVAYGSSSLASKSPALGRIDTELLDHLVEINEKRKVNNATNSSVTVEELGQVPVEPEARKAVEKDKDQQ